MQIQDILRKIDKLLLVEDILQLDLLNGKGGVGMYFEFRFLDGAGPQHEAHAVNILNQTIELLNLKEFPAFVSLGVEAAAPCWLIDSFIRSNLVHESSKIEARKIVNEIISSTTDLEMRSNHHDLFYGFIGKAIICIEHDPYANMEFADKVVTTLLNNSISGLKGNYWETYLPVKIGECPTKMINYGIPHGLCGIQLFLLKYWALCQGQMERSEVLHRSFQWLISKLCLMNNKLPYMEPSSGGTGKLGWCYGDQAIAFTLLRYHETFGDEKALKKAYELIEQTAAKSVAESGVRFYSKYGFHDLRICHGLSSVAYMYFKMYQITKDKYLLELAEKWFDLTLHDLNIYLEQRDRIIEDQRKNPPSDPLDVIDTSLGFLNGLSGVGLALQTYLNPKVSFWDKILLLDRPGRE